MGTEDLKALLVKYDLQLDPKYNEYLGRYKRKRWDSFINNENKHFCTPDAMEHPYFDSIKKSGLL